MKNLNQNIKILSRIKNEIGEIKVIETSEKESIEQLGLAEKEMFLKNLYSSKDGKILLQLRSRLPDEYFHARIAYKEEIDGKIIFQNWKDLEITKEFLEDQFEKIKQL